MDKSPNKTTCDHVSHPLPMSEMCHVYFKTSQQLVSFVGFVCGLVLDTDKKAKIAAKALLDIYERNGEIAAIIEKEANRTTDGKVASYKKTIDEGAGAQKILIRHSNIILEMLLCKATDNFLTYISDLLSVIFKSKPEILKSSETVQIETVLSHENMESLIATLAEKKVNDLSYQGMRDLYKYLQEKMNFKLFADESDLVKAAKIIDYRNLITHNRGVVNRFFLKKDPSSVMKEGQHLTLEVNEVFSYVEFWDRCVVSIEKTAVDKFKIKQPITKFES